MNNGKIWENWEVALGTLDLIFERLVDFVDCRRLAP